MLRRISTRSWREIRKHLRRDARRFSIFVRSFFYFILATSIFLWAVHDFIFQCSERSGSWEHRVDEQWNYQVQHRLGPLSGHLIELSDFDSNFQYRRQNLNLSMKSKSTKWQARQKKWWQRAAATPKTRKTEFFPLDEQHQRTFERANFDRIELLFFLLHSILNDPCHRHVNVHSDWNVKLYWKVILIELNGKKCH